MLADTAGIEAAYGTYPCLKTLDPGQAGIDLAGHTLTVSGGSAGFAFMRGYVKGPGVFVSDVGRGFHYPDAAASATAGAPFMFADPSVTVRFTRKPASTAFYNLKTDGWCFTSPQRATLAVAASGVMFAHTKVLENAAVADTLFWPGAVDFGTGCTTIACLPELGASPLIPVFSFTNGLAGTKVGLAPSCLTNAIVRLGGDFTAETMAAWNGRFEMSGGTFTGLPALAKASGAHTVFRQTGGCVTDAPARKASTIAIAFEYIFVQVHKMVSILEHSK